MSKLATTIGILSLFLGIVSCEQAPKTIEVDSVQLDSRLELDIDDESDLVAIVSPSNATDKTVTWSSSKSSVASVSQIGHVTAKKAGTTTITAIAGGISASCTVTVNEKTPTVNPGTGGNGGGVSSNIFVGNWIGMWKNEKNEEVGLMLEITETTVAQRWFKQRDPVTNDLQFWDPEGKWPYKYDAMSITYNNFTCTLSYDGNTPQLTTSDGQKVTKQNK